MKGRKQIQKRCIAIILSVIMVLSFPVGNLTNVVRVKAADSAKWTIAVYFCGANLESRDKSASRDIVEMMKAKDVPENVNVVIETGGSVQWHSKELITEYYKEIGLPSEAIDKINIPQISADYLQRYKINYNNQYKSGDKEIPYATLELVQDEVAINNPDIAPEGTNAQYMGNQSVFEDFLNYTENTYPAEKNAVILWNHGGGTVAGVCSDSYGGGMLSLENLKDSFAQSPVTKDGGKYDMIGFDACMMGSYETLAVMAPYTEYMTASILSEPGYGWDYAPFLTALGEDSRGADTFTGKELGEEIVKAFGDYYTEKKIDATLACYDLSKMTQSLQKFKSLSESLLYLLNDTEGFAEFQEEVYKKCDYIEKRFDLIDMKQFLKVSSEFAVKKAKEYEATKKGSLESLAKRYQAYATQADELSAITFGEDSLIVSEYDCYPGSELEGIGAIGLYYPTPSSVSEFVFIDDKYPLIQLNESYAAFAYAVAYQVSLKQNQTIAHKLTWNQAANAYEFSADTKLAPYLYEFGVGEYLKQGENYIKVKTIAGAASKVLSNSADVTYWTMNGAPITMDDTYAEDYDVYFMQCKINGKEGTLQVVYDDGKYFMYCCDFDSEICGDEVYYDELKPGDVITPMHYELDHCSEADVSNMGQTAVSDKAFTLKASDFTEDEDIILPIETHTTNDVVHDFYAYPYGGLVTEESDTVINHKELIRYANASVTLENLTYAMNGDDIKPAVAVTSGQTTYQEGKDYKVTYENNVKKGTGSVTVTGLGQYSILPSMKKTFVITEPVGKEVVKDNFIIKVVPSKVVLKTVKRKRKSITVTYKKKAAKDVRYQIRYSYTKKGKKKVAGTTAKGTYTIKNIKKNKKYYVSVRAYITVNNKRYYSSNSKVKKAA